MFRVLFLDKNNYIFATTITLSVLLSSFFSFYYYNGNIMFVTWAFTFGIFLTYYRFGDSKLKQIKCLSTYTTVTFIVIFIAAIISTIHNPFFKELLRTILVFCCIYSQRFFKGQRLVGLFLTVYALLFFYIYPNLNYNNFFITNKYCLSGLIIGYISTSIFTLILPKMKIQIPNINKNITKQSVILTILISLVYCSSHIISFTNPAWICYSIIIVSSGDPKKTLKTSLHRFFGTVIGACIGIILAYLIFSESYYFSLYSCFIFIFLTYFITNHHYGIGIGFATIWLITIFYFLTPTISLNTFILARVLDTTLGIILGLIADLLLLKKSKL